MAIHGNGGTSTPTTSFSTPTGSPAAEDSAPRAIDNPYCLLDYFLTTWIDTHGRTHETTIRGAAHLSTKRSWRRVDVVMADLVKRDINATRRTARGYGDTMPRADNITPEGRAKNRRTEFVVVVG